MYISIIHSSFKKYPVENPLAVQRLGLQVSIAGCMGGELRTHSQKKKKRNTQYKLSNSNRKNFFNSEKELNPKDILMLVESANSNNPNMLNTHINVEKVWYVEPFAHLIWERKITRKYLGKTSSRSKILESILNK